MGETDDFSRLDDPAFLAERARVREAIQALTERYEALTAEFDRRASAQWRAAQWETTQWKAAVR
jgi:hypothetical protein